MLIFHYIRDTYLERVLKEEKMKSGLMVLLGLCLFVSPALACTSLVGSVPPCPNIVPPALTSLNPLPTAEQRIIISDGQEIYALYPSTNVPVFSGPNFGDTVLDSHAKACNLYIIIPGGKAVSTEMVHVAQVYRAEDGKNIVALWNRSGWIDSSRLRLWEPEK